MVHPENAFDYLRHITSEGYGETVNGFGEKLIYFYYPFNVPDLHTYIIPRHNHNNTIYRTIVFPLKSNRERHPNDFSNAVHTFEMTGQNQKNASGSPRSWITNITEVAGKYYREGFIRDEDRRTYTRAMENAMNSMWTTTNNFKDQQIVLMGLATKYSPHPENRTPWSIETEKLNFTSGRDLYAIGVNVPEEFGIDIDKPLAVVFCSLESGNTALAAFIALENQGKLPKEINTYSIFASPVGATSVRNYLQTRGVSGKEYAVFAGGMVTGGYVFGKNDPLLTLYPKIGIPEQPICGDMYALSTPSV